MKYLIICAAVAATLQAQSNAGISGYKPNFRGAANGATIEQALNARLICPVVFGMVGDGTTDNAAKVTACSDAARDRGIQHIAFPPDKSGQSSYLLASAVTLDPSIRIVDMPGGTTFLVPAGASGC